MPLRFDTATVLYGFSDKRSLFVFDGSGSVVEPRAPSYGRKGALHPECGDIADITHNRFPETATLGPPSWYPDRQEGTGFFLEGEPVGQRFRFRGAVYRSLGGVNVRQNARAGRTGTEHGEDPRGSAHVTGDARRSGSASALPALSIAIPLNDARGGDPGARYGKIRSSRILYCQVESVRGSTGNHLITATPRRVPVLIIMRDPEDVHRAFRNIQATALDYL
ncbi:hypothetical protein EDB89DRAFT_2242825 [Lactarius sanguifluus]|nr:hypothetical protein EDB89DRAFT_2242825 [Lactarius sanguifluus]